MKHIDGERYKWKKDRDRVKIMKSTPSPECVDETYRWRKVLVGEG